MPSLAGASRQLPVSAAGQQLHKPAVVWPRSCIHIDVWPRSCIDMQHCRETCQHGYAVSLLLFHSSALFSCIVLQVSDCRALAAIPEHNIMLTGERSGSIKIFQWKG